MQLAHIIAFFAGAVVGALSCFLLVTRSKTETSIERQLRELQEEFTAYRENVNSHFNQTAEMVNTLTENYISVQKHLENAADSFAEPPKSFQLDAAVKLPHKKTKFVSLEAKPQAQDEDAGQDAEFDTPEAALPPRDYAPKGSDKDKGTLAEDYGLHEPHK